VLSPRRESGSRRRCRSGLVHGDAQTSEPPAARRHARGDDGPVTDQPLPPPPPTTERAMRHGLRRRLAHVGDSGRSHGHQWPTDDQARRVAPLSQHPLRVGALPRPTQALPRPHPRLAQPAPPAVGSAGHLLRRRRDPTHTIRIAWLKPAQLIPVPVDRNYDGPAIGGTSSRDASRPRHDRCAGDRASPSPMRTGTRLQGQDLAKLASVEPRCRFCSDRRRWSQPLAHQRQDGVA
jgi:hypothetical protein